MAPPGPRTITGIRFLYPGMVEITFTISGPSAVLNSVQYTISGTGWGPALFVNGPGGPNTKINVPIPSSGWGKEWAFRIRGINNDGNGVYSDIFRFFVPGVPATPPAPTLNLTRPKSISVSWPAVGSNGSPITDYQVEYGYGNTTPKYILTGNRSVVITDAAIGESSYFRVRAKNTVGWSAWGPVSNLLLDGGPRVRVSGTFRHTVAYVRHNGSWKKAIPYVKHNGAWKPGIG